MRSGLDVMIALFGEEDDFEKVARLVDDLFSVLQRADGG